MTLQTQPWEMPLFDKALGALRTLPEIEPFPSVADEARLAYAYQYCASLTYQHSRTFSLASGLLPPAKRRAARALYAFCRISDDLVDRAAGNTRAALEKWHCCAREESGCVARPQALVALAWDDARRRYRIPETYADQLIEGVAADLNPVRYRTFDELAQYAYGVASTVGLMSMHITGYTGVEAVPYAVRLGVALQLTNILRDVGEDWRNGRLYLPLEELAAFGLSEADVATGRVDGRWCAFMRFQIERTRRLYAESLPGIAMLDRDGRFAIAAAARLYEAILEDIAAHDYNVFTRRAHLGAWGKLRRLPAIWLAAQQ